MATLGLAAAAAGMSGLLVARLRMEARATAPGGRAA
jgi:hypothetical protein